MVVAGITEVSLVASINNSGQLKQRGNYQKVTKDPTELVGRLKNHA